MVMWPSGGLTPTYGSFQRGTDEISLVRSSLEQMPTVYHIVNTLAELPVRDCSRDVCRDAGCPGPQRPARADMKGMKVHVANILKAFLTMLRFVLMALPILGMIRSNSIEFHGRFTNDNSSKG
jgi:hypothetical protein